MEREREAKDRQTKVAKCKVALPTMVIVVITCYLTFAESLLHQNMQHHSTRFLTRHSPCRTAQLWGKSAKNSAAFEPSKLMSNADELFAQQHLLQQVSGMKDMDSGSRRTYFSSLFISAGSLIGGIEMANSYSLATDSKLKWQQTPVNKRTGVTVFDAEQAGYRINFVTYLTRFLLTFDPDCQRWWYNRVSEIPRTATAEEIARLRSNQFAAFSASVEVGLQGFGGAEGPSKLLSSLIKRYCPNMDDLAAIREANGQLPLDATGRAKQEREIKEARRQICLLFGLMERNQPVVFMTEQLAAIDNGSIARVVIEDRGSGYAPGYGAPQVRFPTPDAGSPFETATGRAVLSPNGKVLRIDVINRGSGYTRVPKVTISPPAAVRFGDDANAEDAAAEALIFRSGPNKGRIERLQLTKYGSGYTEREIIRIRIASPDTAPQNGGSTATATAVLEYEVSDIQIVTNGTGYAVEKPIKVYVDPPPITARVNMNDPMMARIVSSKDPLPASSIPSQELRKKMPTQADPNSVFSKANSEATKGGGGGGGCTGRACYDRPVLAVAYPSSDQKTNTIFNTFRRSEDMTGPDGQEIIKEMLPQRLVSGASAGDIPEPINFVSGGGSSSVELLALLPAGVGLEYNALYNRYELAVDPKYQDKAPLWIKTSSTRKIDPDFGPRGRAPIERDMQLDVSSYLRFILSGAICCSGVHLALTPIDVVKTKVQTDPARYPGMLPSFKTVLEEEGVSGFLQGWAPTFFGFFIWGGISYSLTEVVRRALTEGLDAAGSGLEVPIILVASATGAFVGSFTICPFESVRIRSVSQKDYAPNIIEVFRRMVREEGLGSLFAAVPLFLAKEIPFGMAKFSVFDLSTAWMYSQFPAAKEDLQLSLLVSLLGGTLGGVAAAVVSNPADVTISTLKKSKSEMSGAAAAVLVVETGGPAALFTGLPLRMIFYSLVVSLQFLVYDSVRFSLGIGGDDLKMYLDVLGGALSESGGPL